MRVNLRSVERRNSRELQLFETVRVPVFRDPIWSVKKLDVSLRIGTQIMMLFCVFLWSDFQSEFLSRFWFYWVPLMKSKITVRNLEKCDQLWTIHQDGSLKDTSCNHVSCRRRDRPWEVIHHTTVTVCDQGSLRTLPVLVDVSWSPVVENDADRLKFRRLREYQRNGW